VATSKATVYAREILGHFDVARFFEDIEGSNLDNTRQDKAEVLNYVLESARLNRSTAVMVGDRKHDLIGAQKCGIQGVGVLFGYGSQEELCGYGSVYIASTVGELHSFLLSSC
jgi:phosphoglycolate phosphatase